jgi:NDP-mannose synthase
MIERLLRQILIAGVRDITVITGWLGEQIQSHLETVDLPKDATLHFIRETKPLGNIGGLTALEPSESSVLMAFADLVTNMDFAELLRVHWKKGVDATLASHHETYQVMLGELVLGEGRVIGYNEKPLKQYTICSGVAVFEPALLAVLERGRQYGISDLISAAIAAGFYVDHWAHDASVLDVNRSDMLELANQATWLDSLDQALAEQMRSCTRPAS